MKQLFQRYRYALWALYLPVYLAAFFFCERVVTSGYWVSYLPIDDAIPFLAPFVIPYYLWFPLLVGTGLYLLFYSPDGFRRYMGSIAFGFTVSIIVFLAFPNGQDLRPAVLPNDGLCCRMVAAIYRADTNTNVLPSVHVLGAMSAVFAVFDSELPLFQKRPLRVGLILLTLLINLSTVFIKQHSVLDLLAGFVVSGCSYLAVYVFWKRAMEKRRGKAQAG